MKKFVSIVTSATVIAFATPAAAQSFSGPYVGADIGYDSGSMRSESGWTSNNGDFSDNYEQGRSINGIAGGVFVGYDHRLNDKVFAGVELRAGYSGATFDEHDDILVEEYDLDRHGHISYKTKESFSATARLGYMLNENTGVYVRGGVVKTKIKAVNDFGFDVSYDPITEEYGQIFEASDNNTGAVFGAGLETSVTSKVTLRMEYNFTQYGNILNDLMDQMSAADEQNYGDPQYYGAKLKNQQVRVGLSYRF